MHPTPRLLLVLLAGFLAALAPTFLGAGWWTLWVGFLAVVAFLAGLDALLAPGRRRVSVAGTAPETVYVGEDAPLTLSLATGGWPLPVRVRLVLDLVGDVLPAPPLYVVVGGKGVRLEVGLRAVRRGTFSVSRAWLRWAGPLGLLERRLRRPLDLPVAVVPNVRSVRTAALAFFRTREAWVGAKVVRHQGEGSEFESLREYVPGLDTRALHWKASARHRKLIAVEHRAERNHPVVVAFDTGRLLREPIGGVPKLDHAIHAGLVLAYAALRTGDRVGLHAFGARPHTFAEPRPGVHTFARLQHLTASLAYSTEETNFTLGLTDLSTRLRRRTLVVLLTDFVDTVTAELMLDNVGRVARRHLVVFVTLRDPGLDAEAEQPPRSAEALYRAIAARDLARERDLVLRRLLRLGVHAIDAAPGAVTPRLLDRYLRVKRRELVG